jgi:hypothetical protein
MANYSSTLTLAALVTVVLTLSACDTSPNYVSLQDPQTGAFVICRGWDMASCSSGYESQGWVRLAPQNISPAAGGK